MPKISAKTRAFASKTNARVMIDARYISDEPSGIGRYTQHLVEELLKADGELKLELITHPSRPRPFEHPRVACQTFAAEPNSLRTRFMLPRAVDFSGVDLFHSPFNILPANLPVPGVFTLHDIMWLLDKNFCTDSRWRKVVTGTFYGQFIPRSVHQATRIFTVSDYSRQEIEEYFPETAGRVHVTYNGIDPVFSPMPPEEAWPLLGRWLAPRSRFVLVVGQGAPYKNHAGALAGFIEAFRDDPDVYFVLVRRLSNGPATRLRELMAEPAVASRIINLESVGLDELRALYSMAQVFLFPSLYEGFGLPALEAMASGTPVVTSNRGAPAEVCGPAGVLVDPESPRAIGQALRRLFEDPAFYIERRDLGIEHARAFTWRRCALATLEIYRDILNLS